MVLAHDAPPALHVATARRAQALRRRPAVVPFPQALGAALHPGEGADEVAGGASHDAQSMLLRDERVAPVRWPMESPRPVRLRRGPCAAWRAARASGERAPAEEQPALERSSRGRDRSPVGRPREQGPLAERRRAPVHRSPSGRAEVSSKARRAQSSSTRRPVRSSARPGTRHRIRRAVWRSVVRRLGLRESRRQPAAPPSSPPPRAWTQSAPGRVWTPPRVRRTKTVASGESRDLLLSVGQQRSAEAGSAMDRGTRSRRPSIGRRDGRMASAIPLRRTGRCSRSLLLPRPPSRASRQSSRGARA